MEEKENGLNQSNTNPEAEKKEEGKLAGILKGTGKGVWKTIKVVFLVWLLLTGVFALFTIGAKVANAGIKSSTKDKNSCTVLSVYDDETLVVQYGRKTVNVHIRAIHGETAEDLEQFVGLTGWLSYPKQDESTGTIDGFIAIYLDPEKGSEGGKKLVQEFLLEQGKYSTVVWEDCWWNDARFEEAIARWNASQR